MNDTFAEIGQVLRQADRIAFGCHVRPDGDALGSIIGMARSLELAGKEVFILSEDGVPGNLNFLPLASRVIKPDGTPLDVQVAVALDTAVKDRLGERTNKAFSSAALLVNMDHHGTNPRYGHLNHIDIASPATGQIVYDFLKSENLPMDDAVRQNLFAAISTDTGSFQFSNTTARTHEIIGEMMRAGSQFADLCQKLYHTHPKRRLLLQRAVLNEMKFSEDDRIVSWVLSRRLQDEVGLQDGDSEGLIDMLRCVEGAVAAVIFEELPDGRVRISARSKDSRLDVSKVCGEFGGGGHRMASGARMPGPVAVAESQFLEALKNELQRTC